MDALLAQPLIIKPARSRYLALFITTVHVGAIGAILWCALPEYFKFIAILLTLGAFNRTLGACWIDFDRASKHEFMLTAAGAWLRRDAVGKTVPLVSVPPVFVHPFLVVVRLISCSGPHFRHDLILLPDNLDAVTLRRLRVRLRSPA